MPSMKQQREIVQAARRAADALWQVGVREVTFTVNNSGQGPVSISTYNLTDQNGRPFFSRSKMRMIGNGQGGPAQENVSDVVARAAASLHGDVFEAIIRPLMHVADGSQCLIPSRHKRQHIILKNSSESPAGKTAVLALR